jgi:hypothetical protein
MDDPFGDLRVLSGDINDRANRGDSKPFDVSRADRCGEIACWRERLLVTELERAPMDGEGAPGAEIAMRLDGLSRIHVLEAYELGQALPSCWVRLSGIWALDKATIIISAPESLSLSS